MPKPHIQIKNKTVLENHLVDLTCEPERAGVSVWWTFNNQRLTATDRVSFSQSNRRLTIDPITRKDAGIYQCGVSNPLISRTSDPVNLAVLCEWRGTVPHLSPGAGLRCHGAPQGRAEGKREAQVLRSPLSRVIGIR